MASQWFVSDLHLSLERSATVELFERFLTDHIDAGDQLYILGDLFDVWIGDDDDAELAIRIRTTLNATSRRGATIAIQRGNRDFLMGKRLMRASGASLLRDCHVTRVAGQRTLLMHGDLLCTDDVDYQKARRRFRNPLFQWLMLRKSLEERRRIAADYRRRSGEATALKAENIMDVNDVTVVTYLQRYGVRQLIHGHTHRPSTHWHTLADGDKAMRLVLPEWHGDRAVAWNDTGDALIPVEVV